MHEEKIAVLFEKILKKKHEVTVNDVKNVRFQLSCPLDQPSVK